MNHPARLSKKLTVNERIDNWALSHQTIILSFCFIAGGILVVILAYTIVGISAVESGAMRNFINGGYV